MGIVVVGAIFVDIKGYPLAPYIPAGRNMGRVETVHGGVCRNVAEDIANIGIPTTFISLVDNTGTGRDVKDRLEQHGCCTRYIQSVEGGLGTWLAVFDNSGDVVASISWRPDMAPVLDILEQHGDEIISQADSVVVEIDTDPAIVHKILTLADTYKKEVFAVVSNMSIALERRELMTRTGCVVCNQQEAGILFSEDYEALSAEELAPIMAQRRAAAGFHRLVVTMGGAGSVWADADGSYGICPAQRVDVKDTTGAGDAFFSGVAAGLTRGKGLGEACVIGTRMAAAVIATTESVCPVYKREEFDL